MDHNKVSFVVVDEVDAIAAVIAPLATKADCRENADELPSDLHAHVAVILSMLLSSRCQYFGKSPTLHKRPFLSLGSRYSGFSPSQRSKWVLTQQAAGGSCEAGLVEIWLDVEDLTNSALFMVLPKMSFLDSLRNNTGRPPRFAHLGGMFDMMLVCGREG
jgi:hypothetical protein